MYGQKLCVVHTLFFLEKVHGRIFFCSSVTTVLSNKGFLPPKHRGVFDCNRPSQILRRGKQGDFPTWLDYHLARSELHHTCLATKKSRSVGKKTNRRLLEQTTISNFFHKKTKPCPLPSVSGNSETGKWFNFFLFFPPPTQAWGPVLSEGGRQRWKLSLEGRGRGDKNCPFRPERKTYLQT